MESADAQIRRRRGPKHMTTGPAAEKLLPSNNASIRDALNVQETDTFTYGFNAHLYWTEATGTDAQGVIVTRATQTLDSDGFRTSALWYDGAGFSRTPMITPMTNPYI